MKLFPVHPIFWSSLLVLWTSLCETEDNNPSVCQELSKGEIHKHSSSFSGRIEEIDENFACLLYPSDILNCSWSFHTLPKDTHLSVFVSICDGDKAVQYWKKLSEERVGSKSWIQRQLGDLRVFLYFNVSQNDAWKVFTYMYDMEVLEVLSPPNISASVIDGALLVTWTLPGSRSADNSECFEYQLDLGDQEEPKILSSQLSYTEPNVDPTQTYRVRIKARTGNYCYQSPDWSDWSSTVTVEESVYKLNILVIISISLGIPMILLAVLLLVRNQRVSELLFPPIPRPPPKYIHFLEKNDTSSFPQPALAAKAEEEITEVEDTEEKTF